MSVLKFILTGFFISLAAFTNSQMDTLTHHYTNSFAYAYSLDAQFWNPAISWKNKYINKDPLQGRVKIDLLLFELDKPAVFTDGWHLLKAVMLLFFFLSSIVWIPVNWWKKLLVFAGFAVIWNVVFEIVYK